MKPNDVIPLRCPSEDYFYRLWVEFLAPFHKLAARDRDVAARIIMQYFKLKETIPDPVVLKEVLWSHTSRQDMRDSLKMTPAHFQMSLAKLRKAGFLTDGDINPKYIPHTTEDPRFMLSIVFDWSSANHPVHAQQD